MRAALRTLLVSALAIVLLYFFLRNADFARVWAAVRAARLDLVTAALALTLVMAFIRAERWQYLLEPLGQTRFWTAFRTSIIGFAASFLLPARAGEVLRPYLLARQESLPFTATFATIIVERVLDLIAVLVLVAAFFLFLSGGEAEAAPRLYQAVALGVAVMTPLGLALLVTMGIMAGHPERLHAIVLRFERILPPRVARAVAGVARTFAHGLGVVRRPRRLVIAMAWSLVLWLCIAGQLWLLVRAFAIEWPFGGAFLVTAMLVVGVAVPTPGGVGGTHEAMRLGLTSFYGADNDAAVGAAIVQHAVNFFPYLFLGLWFVTQDGLNLARLREMSASARQQSSELQRAESASAREPAHEVTP